MEYFRTSRILCRSWEENDFSVAKKIYSSSINMKYMPQRAGWSDDAIGKFISKCIEGEKKNGFCFWALVWLESNQLIGHCGLKYIPNTNKIEIGFLLDSSCWGKGIASEAALAALNFGLTDLKIEKIYGLVVPENTGSVKVLQKIGLNKEGQSREYYGGELLDVYSICRKP